MTPSAARLGVPGLMLLLSGCVGGLLGGGKPDQLYRFGTVGADAPVASVPSATPRSVVLRHPTFPPEVSSDRILTSQGRKLTYIKGARWATSTPAIYRTAIEGSLRSRAAITVLDRAQAGAAGADLRVAIDRFEAVYGDDPKSLPTVHVDGRASLLIPGEAIPRTFPIHGQQRAATNTTGDVAAAFDQAAAQSTSGLADWISVTLPPPAAQPIAPR